MLTHLKTDRCLDAATFIHIYQHGHLTRCDYAWRPKFMDNFQLSYCFSAASPGEHAKKKVWQTTRECVVCLRSSREQAHMVLASQAASFDSILPCLVQCTCTRLRPFQKTKKNLSNGRDRHRAFHGVASRDFQAGQLGCT